MAGKRRLRSILSFLLSLILIFELIPAIPAQAADISKLIILDIDHPAESLPFDKEFDYAAGQGYTAVSDTITWYDLGTSFKQYSKYDAIPDGEITDAGAKAKAGECYLAEIRFKCSDNSFSFAQGAAVEITEQMKKRCNSAECCVSSDGEYAKVRLYYRADTTFFTEGGYINLELNKPFGGTLAAGDTPWTVEDFADNHPGIDLDMSVSWSADGQKLADTAVFEAGRDYRLTVSFNSTEKNNNKTTITFRDDMLYLLRINNGDSGADMNVISPYVAYAVFDFPCKGKISSMDIEGILPPVSGNKPQANGFLLNADAGTVSLNSVSWYKEQAGIFVEMGADDRFEADKLYRLELNICADDAHTFSSISKNDVAVNLGDIESVAVTDEGKNIGIVVELKAAAGSGEEEEFKQIDKIEFYVTIPSKEATVTFKKTDEEGYESDDSLDSDSEGIHNGMSWAEVSDQYASSIVKKLSAGDGFESGKYYAVYIALRAKYGYRFRKGLDTEAGGIKINGYAPTFVQMESDRSSLMMYYVFDPFTDAELTGIEISKLPDKTEYTAGELFDPKGMTVIASYSDGSSIEVSNYSWKPSGALKVNDTAVTVSYRKNDVTKTAEVAITVKPSEVIVVDDESFWNLYKEDSHEFEVRGITDGGLLNNQDVNSHKFYASQFNHGVITVSLRDGIKDVKSAAKAANTTLYFINDNGCAVQFMMPVSYVKPKMKLAASSVVIREGTENTVTTQLLCKTGSGAFEPYCVDGLKFKYGNLTGYVGEGGIISIPADKAMSGKIEITNDNWKASASDPIQLSFKVKAVKKDVLNVEMPGQKSVVLNLNAPDKKSVFNVTFNGKPAKAESITVDDGQMGLATMEDGMVTIGLPSASLKAGKYTVKLKAADSKAEAKIKVVISNKNISDAVSFKVQQKYDAMTGAPMILVPSYKDTNSRITAVVAKTEGFKVIDDAPNDAGNIAIIYTGSTYGIKNTKAGDVVLQVTLDGTRTYDYTLKKVSFRKGSISVKAAPIIIPKGAVEEENRVLASTNIVCTYKDCAGAYHSLTPKSVTFENDSFWSQANPSDPSEVNIYHGSGRTGKIKGVVEFDNGYKKTITIQVKAGK
ncbi:MAG: bacterial Ig-like domain-containing protein [Lachnospiraceae bacterium]|nr:bacterial Ig-like domain-containing protein [Lachnospiraceae bacterium]